MGRTDRDERWRASHARRVLQAQVDSGLTIAAYARREGLCAQRLYSWSRQLGGTLPPPRAFVEVVRPPPARPPSGFEIVLPSGRRVRVEPDFDAENLRRLLDVVDPGASC